MTTSLFDLKGKTAIVTGGGSGLGRDIAKVFAEYGANVAICSRKLENCQDTATEIENEYGVKTMAYECDVSQEEHVKRIVESVIADFGQIDILVNNSGATWGEKVEDMPLAAWNKVFDVNVTGTFLMSREVGKNMISNGSGKIINIGSVAGMKAESGEVLNEIGYSSSKAAVHHFTRDLAKKWAEHDINVNAIAPGFFETKMTRGVLEKSGDKIRNNNPMKRLGDPDSLKGIALFLASNASSFITGQIIAVDGGSSL